MTEAPLASLLIVDDEQAQMRALCETLEVEGYRTTGFSSANAALAALREQTFDLELSDLMMPDMDGIALLHAALEIDPHLVGIVMTGHGTIDTAVKAMQTGALDYILKPFKLSAVLLVLSRALAARRLRMENIQLHEAVEIHKLSVAVAFAADFDEVLRRVADSAIALSGVSAVSVLLPSPDGSHLCVAASRGAEISRVGDGCTPLDAALSGWVEKWRELLSRHGEIADPQLVSTAPPGGIPGISIPMLAGGTLIGILHVIPVNPEKPVAAGQLRTLNILASAAASALGRVSLVERLRGAEERYRRLAENAPDIVFRYDLRPRPGYAYVNPAVEAITGYSAEEHYADPRLSLGIVEPVDRPLL
ncbi:MAG: response regulator, partial [Acidobacteriota bacterium]